MKLGAGAFLVAVGLVVLWLAVTGRLSNMGAAWSVLTGDAPASPVTPTGNASSNNNDAGRIAAALQLPFPFPSMPTLRSA